LNPLPITALFLATALLLQGCVGRTSFELVEFQAPSNPDPELSPILKDVKRIGVLSITNIEPVRELDIEKVMGRLADGMARGLARLPDVNVLTQDEIRWHFNYAAFDSLSVLSPQIRTTLREELELDAMVYVELNSLQAQLTPVSPTPYGDLAPTPGLDLSVKLQVTLFNLHTDAVWRHDQGQQRNWQPVQVQPFGGGGDQTERQLMTALVRPLRQFLGRVAPPPRKQVRHFEISGD
jgi:hypothetical protein